MTQHHTNNKSENSEKDNWELFKPAYFWRELKKWWHTKWWHKIIIIIMAVVFLFVSSSYAVAQWYIATQRNKPMELGATFISAYSERLGVDPQATLRAMIDELGIRHLRLVSYWDEIEHTEGKYDFSGLDWQFKMAEEADAKVSLAIGLRQPRWPECHMPTWALKETKDVWQPKLNSFIGEVINHYKDHPALVSYQLENEFFLSVFGECPDFSRDRLVAEAKLVKKLDSKHPLIISRSNNAIGLPLGQPRPDMFGVSVYKRVWDATVTKRYFEYPFPAWFYGSLAGWGKIFTGKDLIIHELQAEAWPPPWYDIKTAPVDELYKSMNPERLKNRIQYGTATGMKHVDLWGVEWWYQMKVVRGEPGLWNTAKEEIAKSKR